MVTPRAGWCEFAGKRAAAGRGAASIPEALAAGRCFRASSVGVQLVVDWRNARAQVGSTPTAFTDICCTRCLAVPFNRLFVPRCSSSPHLAPACSVCLTRARATMPLLYVNSVCV
eukprot:327575-Pyramimonas_sp.AAC.1